MTSIRKRRRSKTERARDKRRIAALYLEGKFQEEIADILQLSQSTISDTLKELQQEWLDSALMDINTKKASELAKIDELERKYLAAYERSCGEIKTITRRGIARLPKPGKGEPAGDENTKPAPVPTSQEITEHIETQLGDPRYLNGVLNCIERRCAILGLDAPKRTDITSGGNVIKAYTVLANPDQWDEPAGDEPKEPATNQEQG